MAIRRVCDRCMMSIDTIIERRWKMWENKKKRFKEWSSHFLLECSDADIRYDLCPECNKEFSKFMEGYKMSNETIHQGSNTP